MYDAAGNRILENSPTGSTLYLGETELTTDATGKITRASRAYSHPGAPTVVRTATNGSGTGHTLSALISDHLGTANTTVELGASQTVTRRAFKPYGEARGPKPALWPNKRSYLGTGIDDTATGLTHLGAREYDQAAGRFLSADPVIDVTEPLQMNGYAYAGNSPVSSSDPTGLCPAEICGAGKANPGSASGQAEAAKAAKRQEKEGSNPYKGAPTVTYTITKTVTVTKPAPCDFICKGKRWLKKYKTEIITITTEVVVGVACGAVAVGAGAATGGVGAVAVGASCGAIAGAAAGAVGNALDPEADKSLGGFAKAAGKGAAVGAVASVVGGAVGKAIAKGVKAVASKIVKRGSGAGSPKGSGSSGGSKGGGGSAKSSGSGGAKGTDSATLDVPSSSFQGNKLAERLRLDSANSPFNQSGHLTPDAIAESRLAMPGVKMGNKDLQARFAERGGASQWGKYSTVTHQSPYGDYQVHYYMNRESGEVLYDYDYKVVMNRRGSTP
ncbi:RHS repeat domain-containing protein [Streptomyces sp. NPDC050509]|uniref:RHS repeat domain-containing protein n=1 Tax=Streptomyces sp. NPDC050509 TaxID=3365620 RepID=UPI003791F8E9